MKRVAILSAVRTPIGKFGGQLLEHSAVALGEFATRAALERAGIKGEQVGLTIIGVARQAGCGPNPARQISIRAGIPQSTPAYTLNQACASGLATISQAVGQIRLGEAEVVVAGGAESMSNVPYMLDNSARWGLRLGHKRLTDAMYQDGLFCPLADMVMGETVEALANEFSISRDEQDEFAVQSQNRCENARAQNLFADELVTVTVRKGEVTADEHPRDGVTVEKLGKLRPVFAKDGSITAGNASGITDGASALVLASEAFVEQHGLEPLAWYGAGTTVGLAPERMGLGPVHALNAFLGNGNGSLKDYDLIEVNEAFAAQVLACHRQLPLPLDRVNVNGGAIALGHPIGCTGNRIVVTMLHELKRREGKKALATLCVSGGLGIVASFERMEN